MVNTKNKLNIATIIFFVFLLTPFFSIVGIRNAMGEGIYQAWQVISICSLIFMFFVKNVQIKINWAVLLFTIYEIIILFSCALNNRITLGIIAITMASILIFVLLQTDLFYNILSAVSIIVFLALIINFPFVIQNSAYSNAEYFIGGKNALGIFLIPGMFLLMLSSLEKYNKLSKVTLFAIPLGLLTIFIGSSGTGIVVAIFTILFLLLAIKFNPNKTIYLVVIFTIYSLLLLFSDFFLQTDSWLNITSLLGKDTSLTSRTTIWNLAWNIIKENWLFGAGRGVELSYPNKWEAMILVTEAHNFILEILLEGGFVALIIFGVLFFKSVYHLNMKNPKHKIIFIAICLLLINGLTESTVNSYLVTMILGVTCRYATEHEKKSLR